MTQIKALIHQRTQKLVDHHQKLANSKLHDNTNISFIIKLHFILKTIQLIIYLLCGSYFTGMFWLILCKHSKNAHLFGDNSENFYDGNEMGLKTVNE